MHTPGAKLRQNLETLKTLMQAAPYARALGLELVEAGDDLVLKIPYRDELIGNFETGVVHGGVITSLLDHTLGFAVFGALETLAPIATLDLRIDYMRAAEPGRDIFARGRITKITKSIAFVRGTAYHDGEDPIAMSTAAFMINTRRREARP